MGTLRMEIRSFPPASARIWNSLSTAAVRPGDLWDWKSLSKRMQWSCLPQARGLCQSSLLMQLQDIFITTLPLKQLKPSWVPGARLEVGLYGAVGWCPGDTAECCRAVITQGVQDVHPPASSMQRAKHGNWRGQCVTGRPKTNCFR